MKFTYRLLCIFFSLLTNSSIVQASENITKPMNILKNSSSPKNTRSITIDESLNSQISYEKDPALIQAEKEFIASINANLKVNTLALIVEIRGNTLEEEKQKREACNKLRAAKVILCNLKRFNALSSETKAASNNLRIVNPISLKEKRLNKKAKIEADLQSK